MPAYFPILLAAHIVLALGLVLPSILLPFALRTRRATVESGNDVVRSLLWAQTHGTLVLGLGLALTGLALVATLGSSLLGQPWLLVALAIYFVNLGLAFFVQRPEPAPARRDPRSGRRHDLAPPGEAPALRLVPDGRPGRHDRVPDELEAGALVTTRRPPTVRRAMTACSAGSSTDRSRPTASTTTISSSPSATSRPGPRPTSCSSRCRHIASAADLTEADGPLLGRLFAVAADLARTEGIADGGYRLVSNVGRWGGQTVDHLHVHLMGGRPFDWPPG